MGSSGISKAPSLSDVTVRGAACPVNVAVTVTPGTTAPDGSFTVPRMAPFVCPMEATQNVRLMHAVRHTRTHAVALIDAPLENSASIQTPPIFRLQRPEKPYYNSRTLEDGL